MTSIDKRFQMLQQRQTTDFNCYTQHSETDQKKGRDSTVFITFLCLFLGFRSSERNYQHESSP